MKKLQNFNYHGHTFRCGHADSTMSDEDFVKEFIKKDLRKYHLQITVHIRMELTIEEL